MFEQIKKSFDKSLELAFSTKDKIQQSVIEIARENNLTKAEAKKLLDQVMKKSEEVKKNLEEKVTELQKAAMEKMNLVSKEEFGRLEKRILMLEKQLKVPGSSKTPSKLPVKAARKKTIKRK